MRFSIRDLTTYDEMWAVHRLQQAIWGLDDPTVGLYPALLWSVAKNGGIVLGAFDESDALIAFLFSYIGREADGYVKLYSQIMGVHHEWRGRGVGEALKRAQRERALGMGLVLINWTTDPLEAANARLNIGKLRAISRTYWRDIYGSTMGALNAGLPTDRILMEWWIGSEWVDQPAKPEKVIDAPRILNAKRNCVNLNLDAPLVVLEIPASIQDVKRDNPERALEWRIQTRSALEGYFQRGYAITDFVVVGGRGLYVLEALTDEMRGRIGVKRP